ncbi:uncharacterized protein EI90DRAFT_2473253 [Cantharellus anzutake]|uniref:uncharacterized protein n=1 Tax=Cantharellus anzutake TaxID=1750568 RepID=UPI00190499C6|nr:uncharacterized protein EI90DRAFT_2473253 [Cantharellus anzutake]KAF8322755.1 hypothetical protein EI90DRAFT_2473253 [Cantharellus anzutake]
MAPTLRAGSADPPVEKAWVAAWTPVLASAVLGSVLTIAGISVYVRFFRRFPTSDAVRPVVLAERRWIKGVVTSVGDGDNFRLYHTPGPFWSKFRRVPDTSKELQNKTIHIRLSAVDAPEAGHFGRPPQPYASEAIAWLKSLIQGRRVHCQLVRRDQYGRIVANVHLPPRILPSPLFTGKNVSYEMIRAGWATAYLQSGAEYGTIGKEGFLKAEADAKAARRGMWAKGLSVETPAEYKRRFALDPIKGGAQVPQTTERTRGFLRNLWPWRS